MKRLKRIAQLASKERADTILAENLNVTVLPSDFSDSLRFVVKVKLANNRLSSFPYASFKSFQCLEILDLSHNAITDCAAVPQLENLAGTLSKCLLEDNRIVSMPDFSRYKKLRTLDLKGNLISDFAPSQKVEESKQHSKKHFGGLLGSPNATPTSPDVDTGFGARVRDPGVVALPPSLKKLNLSCNRFRQIPDNVFRGIEKLKLLRLEDNQLTGLPSYLPPSIVILHCEHNKLDSLPLQMKALWSLRELDLHGNKLIEIPGSVVEGLRSLVVFQVFHNRLKEIPPEIGNCSFLEKLSLTHNYLTTLPAEIGNLKHLLQLDLFHNQLERLPPSIFGCERLITLSLDTNNLEDLPAELGLMRSIEKLSLTNNPLSSIPRNIVEQGSSAVISFLGESLSGKEVRPAPMSPVRPTVQRSSVSFSTSSSDYVDSENVSGREIPIEKLFADIAAAVNTRPESFADFVSLLERHFYFTTDDLRNNNDWQALLPSHITSRVRKVLGDLQRLTPGSAGAGSADRRSGVFSSSFSTTGFISDDEISSFGELRARLEVYDPVETIDRENLTLLRLLGKGGFGEVFLARYHGSDVAVKVLPGVDEDIFKEMEPVWSLRHPNIALCYGVVASQPFSIVMELCHESLEHRLQNGPKLSWRELHSILVQTALGLNFLHTRSRKIIHKCLKPSNILLSRCADVKVTDFGQCKLKQSVNLGTQSVTFSGPPAFLAPELVRKQPYGTPCDVYSFAMVAWQCLSGKMPFEEMPVVQLLFAVAQGERPSLVRVPVVFRKLIEACWDNEPLRRPSFARIVEWLGEIETMLGSDEWDLSLTETKEDFLIDWSGFSNDVDDEVAPADKWALEIAALKQRSKSAGDPPYAGELKLNPPDMGKLSLSPPSAGDLKLSPPDGARLKLSPPGVGVDIPGLRESPDRVEQADACSPRSPSPKSPELRSGDVRRDVPPRPIRSPVRSRSSSSLSSLELSDISRRRFGGPGCIRVISRFAEEDGGSDETDLREREVERDKHKKRWVEGTRRITRCSNHSGQISSLCVQGSYCVTGGSDKRVTVYDVERKSPVLSLVGHEKRVYACKYDGETLVTSSKDETIRVWQVADALEEHSSDGEKSTRKIAGCQVLRGHTGGIPHLLLHGDRFVSGSLDKTVRIWKDFKCVAVLQGHSGSILDLDDGQDRNTALPLGAPPPCVFASASYDGSVKLWDGIVGSCTASLLHGDSEVDCVRKAPFGFLAVSAGHDGQICLWDARCPSKPAASYQVSSKPVIALAVDWRDGLIVGGGYDGNVNMIPVVGGGAFASWGALVDEGISPLSPSSQLTPTTPAKLDRRRLEGGRAGHKRTSSLDHSPVVFDADNDVEAREHKKPHRRPVRTAIAKAFDVRRKDSANRKQIAGHSDWVKCLRFSAGLVLSGSRDGTVKLWDPSANESLITVDHVENGEEALSGVSAVWNCDRTMISTCNGLIQFTEYYHDS